MMGLDLGMAGSMLVLAAAGGNTCIMPKATEITITPVTKPVKQDSSQSLAQLQTQEIDTIDPHSFGGQSFTQGYMKGSIGLHPQVRLGHGPLAGTNGMCIWYESIDIKIEIDPTIVIAREVAADKCMGKAVLEHEKKHVQVDRQIVNKYAQIMGQKLKSALAERGFVSEPMLPEHAQSVAERMQTTVYQILEHEYKKMDLERVELQSQVDSREEYERVKNLCPAFGEKLYAIMGEGKASSR